LRKQEIRKFYGNLISQIKIFYQILKRNKHEFWSVFDLIIISFKKWYPSNKGISFNYFRWKRGGE